LATTPLFLRPPLRTSLFFSMPPPPPRSTLFPYTTLFRSHRPHWGADAGVGKTVVSSGMIDRVSAKLGRRLHEVPVGFKWFVAGRSEEHTSELQSLAYLVCRLLLEKKNKKI